MKDLLKSYQNAYDFKLRLTINNQPVFNGFEGSSHCELSFMIQQDLLLLECNADRKEVLKGIQIALSHIYQKEDFLLKLIQHEATGADYQKFSSVCSCRNHRLILMQSQSDLMEVKQMLHHLFEKNVPMTMVEDSLVMVIEDDEKIRMQLSSIKDTLEAELYGRVRIISSSRIDHVEQLGKAYEEVLHAQKLMQHYEPSVDLIDASECWLMELVDQLETHQAQQLIHQLSLGSELDDELTSTALCFLENNLSISTTARALYIHRNTLIYRLDKIMQLTDLDLRIFEDAMKFKVLMTLKKK